MLICLMISAIAMPLQKLIDAQNKPQDFLDLFRSITSNPEGRGTVPIIIGEPPAQKRICRPPFKAIMGCTCTRYTMVQMEM